MLRITARLTGVSPISFSAPVKSEKKTGEPDDVFERRTWQERMHVNEDGELFIPPMAVKNCLSEVAKFLSQTVQGKRGATYTKHFEAGILVVQPILLGVKAKDVKSERLFVPSNGNRGGGKRVWKYFPFLPSGWSGVAELFAMDPTLTDNPKKIEEYLNHAGKFIGLGRFRPRNNGFYGRFSVSQFKSQNVKE